MKWNGRYYRPGYGVNVYPKPEDSIKELLKPLGEKTRKGNVWIPVLNQPINVLKDDTTPVPPVSPSPTPTQTGTPTPTPSSTVPEPSPSPTPTGTGTPTPTPSPSNLPPTEITYLSNVFSNTTASSYTFSGVSFGTTGLVVVGIDAKRVGSAAGYVISSVTIGGISATQTTSQNGFNNITQGIWTAEVTGTTGDIVVNLNASTRSLGVGIWRINNYTSTTPVFTGITQGVTSTLSVTTSSLTPTSVGVGTVNDQSAGTNIAWTNATERYEQANSDGPGGNRQDTSGCDFTQNTSGTRTVTSSNLTTSGALLQLAVWE